VYTEIIILMVAAIFAAIAREYYNNKGFFVLPHNTNKGLSLGSFGAILTALFAVLVNFALIPSLITIPIAISLGISWGIAAPDIVANVFTKK